MQKKILFLPAYCYPEHDSSSHLAGDREEALINAGYDILVYAATPSRNVDKDVIRRYSRIKKESFYDGHKVIRRYRLFQEHRNTSLRALRYVVQVCKQFNRAVFKKCDVMWISSTPPIKGAIIGLASTITKVPMVLNLQDVFPDSMVSTGMCKKGGLLWRMGNAISNYTYGRSEKIITISEDFRNILLSRGVPINKIEVIYNWIDENKVFSVDRMENVLFDRYNLDRSKFYITYCGNVGLTQNMDLLLDVMTDLNENYPDIHLVIIGNGVYHNNVKNMVETNNMSNVTLLPFQPYEDIAHVFSLGDVGLVISKPGVGENSVPSKTWSIMSASRPVLANFDENELKSIVADNKCGLFTKAGDKGAFKEAIINLYSNRELCSEMGKNGRDFIMKYLTKDVAIKRFVEVIDSVIK